ncbi:MAG: AEC family transporter, partial [Cyanobacteriota bacterium]
IHAKGAFVLLVAYDVLAELVLGLQLGYRVPALPTRLAAPLVAWGIPITLVGLLLRSGLGGGLLFAGAAAALINGIGFLLLLGVAPLRRALANGGLQLGAVVGNTGYFGIPVALALLPPQALGYSITYDLVGTLITWSVGPLLIGGMAITPAKLLAIFLGSPALKGLAIALAIHLTPWGDAVAGLLWIPSRLVLLLALTVVGMRLGVMLRRPEGAAIRAGEKGPLATALAFKLLVLPLLALVLGQLLRLPELVRNAVVLQAAAPTAISVLLIAEAAGMHQDRTAHLVLWSTLLALVSVPLWWWWVGT